jgi:putative transposase
MIDSSEREQQMRFLIHDRDAKFSAAFDEVFRTEGIQVIRTPFKAPNANAYAERFVRTLREECLDWLLILGRGQLERVLCEYVYHYNRERPHRALELRAPQPSPPVIPLRPRPQTAVGRRDRLGGLIHEYAWAA